MTIRIDPARDVLGLIDVQPTFMPGGELPVPDGDAVVPVINRLLAGPFQHGFATQDWHAPGHVSFASTHGLAAYDTIELPYGLQTLWPDHGVQGSANAELHRDLDLARIDVVLRKGVHGHMDSYSAFMENDRQTGTGLAGMLRERGYTRVFMTGLAADFCVAWSAEDAARMGFSVVVVEDAARGVAIPDPTGGTSMDAARRKLMALGIVFANSRDLE